MSNFIRVENHVWEFQCELTDAEVLLNIKNRLGGEYAFERLSWEQLTLEEKNKILSEKMEALIKNRDEYQQALTNLRASMKVAEFKLQKFYQGSLLVRQ
jgi:hypothetical protein